MLGNKIDKKIDIVIFYKNHAIGTQTVEEQDAAFYYRLYRKKENVVDVKMYKHQEVKFTDGKR